MVGVRHPAVHWRHGPEEDNGEQASHNYCRNNFVIVRDKYSKSKCIGKCYMFSSRISSYLHDAPSRMKDNFKTLSSNFSPGHRISIMDKMKPSAAHTKHSVKKI